MIGSIRGRWVVVALMGLAIGCQHRGPGDQASDGVGAMGVALRLSSGQHVDAVHYRLSGGALTAPVEADVNVAGEATTFGFQISGVPAGAGYKVELSAHTNETPPLSTCAGSLDGITIVAGAVVNVDVALVCRGVMRTTGGMNINASVQDVCPTIDTWVADRSQAQLGAVINLSATGHDPDATDALTFTWSSDPGAGVFTPANGVGKNVTFECRTNGNHILALTLSDGQPICNDQTIIDIVCGGPSCGDGMLEPFEECDPAMPGPDAARCRPNCTLARCGDGILDGFTGEACDDGNTANNDGCTSTCLLETCGDGIRQSNEACDTGPRNGAPGNRCQVNCTVKAACGDGIVDPPEFCDPPNGTTCSATCTELNEVCDLCDSTNTNSNCKPLYNAVEADPRGRALLVCIHATRCDQIPSSNGNPDPTICFCGANYDPAVCVGAGQQPGPCAAQYLATLGITRTGSAVTAADNLAVASNFYDTNLIFGAADVMLLKCEEMPTRCEAFCSTATP